MSLRRPSSTASTGEDHDSGEVLERVQAGLGVVDQVVRSFGRFLHGVVETDDLTGYGRIGLLGAARRFEPARGIPFEAYAAFCVRVALLDAVRVMGLSRRTYERMRAAEEATRFAEGLVERTFVSKQRRAAPGASHRLRETMAAMNSAVAMGLIAEVAPQHGGELVSVERSDPEEELANAQFKALIASLIDGLPHPEDLLIRRHYLEGERFDKVASDLEISKWQASRLHSRAIRRLTKRLRHAD